MKKLLAFLMLSALACTASVALANNGAMDLSWGRCDISAASMDRTYACDGQLGSTLTLTGSFIMPFGVPDFAGVSAALDIETPVPTPDYWRTDAAGCNAGAITLSNPPTGPPCGPQLFDPGFSGGGFAISYPTPTRIRINVDWASGAATPSAVMPLVRYAGFGLVFDPDQGALRGCAGCQVPACIKLNQIEVYGFAAGEDYPIEGVDMSNEVTWQSASGAQPCHGATPSQNKTWGSVKALYR